MKEGGDSEDDPRDTIPSTKLACWYLVVLLRIAVLMRREEPWHCLWSTDKRKLHCLLQYEFIFEGPSHQLRKTWITCNSWPMAVVSGVKMWQKWNFSATFSAEGRNLRVII